ncbi:MAG: hypothetical protein AB7E52_07300 [Bdellovibrionales bacterium]
MNTKFLRLICTVLFAFSFFYSAAAYAEVIQMLPPVQHNDVSKPCAKSGGNKVLSWDGETPIKCQSGVIINSNGQVGVGTVDPQAKLDVVGAVRIGADNSICTAAKVGAMRYNSSSAQMEFCNGSAWTRVATGPLFGGVFQTYLCDVNNVFHGEAAGGGCRIPNTVTSACSCPAGYTMQHIGDFNASTFASMCPQMYYESRGMVQWVCVKP